MDIEKVCDCGRVVWSGALPRYEEEVRCPEPACQRDHSRTPPLGYRLRHAWYQLGKWRLYYGLRGMLVIWLLNPALLPRERHKYQLPPYEAKKARVRQRSIPPA